MNFNPEIFRAYDIRGVYGHDFDEELALRLGMALVRYLGAKKLVVARDLRSSSLSLADSLKNGIKNMGCDIVDLGPATSPLFYFAIRDLGADGGVIVTASHNRPEYNGFKIYRHEAMPIGSGSGLMDLKKIVEGPALEKPKYAGLESPDSTGSPQAADTTMKKYLDFVIKNSGLKPKEVRLAVGVDTGGPVDKELTAVFETLGIKSADANNDITFKFDSDGDRLTVIDGQGQQIRGDLIVGLLALSLPKGWFKKPKLVHELRFSHGVLEYLASKGIKLIRSKAGRTFIKEAACKYKADIGGELSGHMCFKEMGYAESAMLGMLKLLRVLSESGQKINSLVEPMMTWFNSGEINITVSDQRPAFNEISRKIKEKYRDGKIDELDGITVEYDDPADGGASWWFNLRPSNTEPVLRLVVEAKTKNLLEEKINEIEELIKI